MNMSSGDYPYMDTFTKAIAIGDKKIKLSPKNGNISLQSQEGNLQWDCIECGTTCENNVYSEDYCDNCINTFICFDCGHRMHDSSLGFENEASDLICEGCASNYSKCEECDRWIKNDSIIDGKAVCAKCLICTATIK